MEEFRQSLEVVNKLTYKTKEKIAAINQLLKQEKCKDFIYHRGPF